MDDGELNGEGDDRGNAPDEPTPPRARAHGNEAKPQGSSTQIMRTLQRIEEAEDAFLTDVNVHRVEGTLARKWGISRSQARRYVNAVKARLAEEGAADREAKRDSIRARLRMAWRVAMERERGYVVATGRDAQTVETAPDPDVRAAVNALELESRLDGLLEQPAHQTVVGFGDEALAALARFYGGNHVIDAEVVEAPADVPELPAEIEKED